MEGRFVRISLRPWPIKAKKHNLVAICAFVGIDLCKTLDIECEYQISRFGLDLVDHEPWVGELATNVIADIPALMPIKGVSLLSNLADNRLKISLEQSCNPSMALSAIEFLVAEYFPEAHAIHISSK